MNSFEKRWEKFRLEKEIPQETFVTSGYSFVDDLEEFVRLELQTKTQAQKEIIEALVLLVLEAKAFVPTQYDNYVPFKTRAREVLSRIGSKDEK